MCLVTSLSGTTVEAKLEFSLAIMPSTAYWSTHQMDFLFAL